MTPTSPTLANLPPPPTGAQGMTLDQINSSTTAPVTSLSNLPPPPTGAKGVTLDQIPKTSTPSDSFLGKVWNGVKSVGNALTSSEQGFGNDIATAIVAPSQIDEQAKLQQQGSDMLNTLAQKIVAATKAGQDTTALQHAYQIAQTGQNQSAQATQNYINSLPTTGKVLGDAGGTALDIASAGTYGAAAKGAETGVLAARATKGASIAGKVATPTLQTIGKEAAVQSLKGGATGYAYDVSQNAKAGDTGVSVLQPGAGTVIGAALPIGIGGIRAASAIGKAEAPRVINSLVKPLQANFAYGKNPGRTVAALGITGNSIDNLGHNINLAKTDIGQQIGNIYSSEANAGVRIDATKALDNIDGAIATAAKGGKNNQGIVTTLQNIKDSLLYSHGVNADGAIVKMGTTPQDISNLTAQEAFQLKNEIAARTQFTGRASDDKTVNSVLQNIYRELQGQITSKLEVNNPEIRDLNQKYADLTSASIAVQHRADIVERSNLIGLKTGGAGAVGTTAALILGTAALPAVLTGIGVAGLEKALGTTAVKSRVAAWLGKESPSVIQSVLTKNPAISKTLFRIYPQIAAKLGKQSPIQ